MKCKQFKAFIKTIHRSRMRILVAVTCALALITIPPRIAYSFPDIQIGEPPIRPISIPIPDPQPYPINTTQAPAPNTTARSIMVVNVPSKAIIYMKNPNQRLYPASTTKMVTAMVAYDNYELSKVASISAVFRQGQIMELYQDENITIENLIKGTLIYSANDAAEALASLHPKGRDYFIAQMNQTVRNLGLIDTHFENPTGLDHVNHYSTVHDLALIGAQFVQNERLLAITSTQSETVADITGQIVHQLTTTNELLGTIEGMKGLKTGWTEYAGECLVTFTERDGKQIITAVLGSQDRFGETQQLIDWVFQNHQWQDISLD